VHIISRNYSRGGFDCVPCRLERGEKVESKIKEALHTTVNVYLVLLLAVLPLYMQEGYVMLGSVKYRFFRNVTLFFCVTVTVMQLMRSCRVKRKLVKFPALSVSDVMALCFGGGAVLSWLFAADREIAWQGYPGWYMGLLSQLLFIWIYFTVSRWYDGSGKALWAFLVSSVAVMGLGVLNRYVFDPLSVFEGVEGWSREHLLSTIGNQNWYCGFISVASSVCLFYACAGKGLFKGAGYLGSMLLFWTLMTQGSESGYLILIAVMTVFFFWALDERKRLLSFFSVAACCPAAALLGRYCIRFRGLMLVEDGTLDRLLFWEGWPFALVLCVIFFTALFIREKKGCRDRLAGGGGIRKAAASVFVIALITGAAVFTGCQLSDVFWRLLGEKELLRMTDAWGNGRGALWRVGIGSFWQGGVIRKLLGAGPDCFSEAVYALYPVQEIVHATGQWEKALYANAHNEWLNMLVNQGLWGLVSYAGIFITVFYRLWRSRNAEPGALFGMLAVSGYCIHGLVSFQQTVSTPLIFGVLGISEALLRGGAVDNGRGQAGTERHTGTEQSIWKRIGACRNGQKHAETE